MPAHGCNFVVTVVWKSPFSAVRFCGPVTPPWHVLTTALSLGTQSLLWLDRSGPAAGHDLGTLCRRPGCGRPTSAIWRLRAVDVAVRQKSRAPPPLRRGVWAAAVTRLGRRHYSRGSRFLSSSFKQKGGVLWTRTEHPKNPGCSRVKPASRGPWTAARVEGRLAPSPSLDRTSRLWRTRSVSPWPAAGTPARVGAGTRTQSPGSEGVAGRSPVCLVGDGTVGRDTVARQEILGLLTVQSFPRALVSELLPPV